MIEIPPNLSRRASGTVSLYKREVRRDVENFPSFVKRAHPSIEGLREI